MIADTLPPPECSVDTQRTPALTEFDLHAMGLTGVDLSAPDSGFAIDLLVDNDDDDAGSFG